MAETNHEGLNPETIDLQERLFEEKVLSQIRQHLPAEIGKISGKELEEKLVNLFRESRTLRSKTNFAERVSDVLYFFSEDLRLEYEQGIRLKGVSQQELDNFLNPILNFGLENLKNLIESRKSHQGEKTTLPFTKK